MRIKLPTLVWIMWLNKMKYMGGKFRQSPKIAEMVGKHIKSGMTYYEPFCGALGAALKCVPVAEAHGACGIVLSDVSECLITMWKASLSGWVPPATVSLETYKTMEKTRDPTNPLTAYCGFGLSFGGRYFEGLARDKKKRRNYALEAKKSILQKTKMLQEVKIPVTIKHCDYREIRPIASLLYLDPPYANSTKAHDFDKFSYPEFWDYVRDLVAFDNIVLITNFVAPKDFVRVFSWGDTTVRHHSSKGTDGTNESIFMHKSQVVKVK